MAFIVLPHRLDSGFAFRVTRSLTKETHVSFTDKLTVSYTGNGTAVTSAIISKTADADAGFDNTIADGTTNGEVDVAFTVSGLAMCILTSDRAVTVKTNSTGSPQETINLAAGAPLIYYSGGPWAIPFAGAVTKMYISNASGGAAHVQFRALYDSTPVLP